MKLITLGLAIITSLVLMFSVCLPVQASEEEGSVDLTATVPLTISDVSASTIGYHGATISWKTNGDATSQVFYDTVSHDNTADYAHHSAEGIDLVSEHSIRLTGGSSGSTYYYRVRSAIPDTEFINISEDYTFRTSTPAPLPPPPTIETNLFGIEESLPISEEGEIQETIEATSEGENLTMTIPQGTIALDEEGEPLETLEVAVDESPPDPPADANIIGLAYDFGPDSATFDPAITLEYTYDPDALPEDVAEEDLVLAYYDEATGEWIELDCVVDTENNTITASVAHFTTFAIIGTVTPPEEEVPTEEEEEEEVPIEEEEEEVLEEEEVTVLEPAAFSVSNLSVEPAEVLAGEEVKIDVAVTNTGGTQGSYTVVLKIDGVKEADRTVTIDAGDTLNLIFLVTKEKAGSYTITVDGLRGSFTVVAPAGSPWPLIGGILGGVLIVGLLIFFLRFHRRE